MIEAHILASGSTGNALFFVLGHTRILVDFGISTKRLRESLDQLGHSISQLDGIFITHEHTDHVRGLNTFLRQYGGQIPVFARAGTLARLPGGADCIG
ncbi:MAG: MBL fold metallo-hydrolase, partial [Negativicutes bacterium]|nr:MBL fold metallo-hydrolase [Negativicutes bacterium]